MNIEHRPFLASVTRATGWAPEGVACEPLVRPRWRSGDFVVAEMISEANPLSKVELSTGRMIEIVRGDRLVGSLGRRAATLECVGSFEAIAEDGLLDLMTPAGLLGKITSQSNFLGQLPRLRYLGHVRVQGDPANMHDFVGRLPLHPLKIPVVMIVGTSMSAGKTATARVIIRLLRQHGMRVAAAKLTGAARYRDVLSMHDAGAEHILDFVDVGLPSSICPEPEYVQALDDLLTRVAMLDVDVLVAEAGASPLEPYNGAAAIRILESQIRFMALAASDPYAVVGVMRAFERRPHLVTGISTNTSAAIALVEKLTGLKALNILDESSWDELGRMLISSLSPSAVE